MEKKVYCNKCKHLFRGSDFSAFTSLIDLSCHCPNNVKTVDTWLRQRIQSSKPPWNINKNNNCKWFEQKKPKVVYEES